MGALTQNMYNLRLAIYLLWEVILSDFGHFLLCYVCMTLVISYNWLATQRNFITTRNPKNYELPKCRTNCYQDSFVPYCYFKFQWLCIVFSVNMYVYSKWLIFMPHDFFLTVLYYMLFNLKGYNLMKHFIVIIRIRCYNHTNWCLLWREEKQCNYAL